MIQPDPRRYAPASGRNRQAILEVLARILPPEGRVLEIASGSGEHAVWFTEHLGEITWQPSDPSADCRASIAAHAADSGCDRIEAPLDIDVTRPGWPVSGIDAIVCINMIHIAPWAAAEGLMAGAGRLLPAGGPVYLYGPFRRDGRHTAPSNARFDETLRAQDPRWGVRDLEAVRALAEDHGLTFRETVEMPANNLSVWFDKR
jgi:cyclopropane fatty-acyl-phospholipid synthase-like methyltransferase